MKIDDEPNEDRKQEIIEVVKKGSILWWGHFNQFLGRSTVEIKTYDIFCIFFRE